MENIEAIKPQPRTLDAVHGEYAALSEGQKRDRAFAKLDEYIKTHSGRARQGVQKILAEAPRDRIVRAQALSVQDPRDPRFTLFGGEEQIGGFHDHALGQLAERFGFPRRYLGELRGTDWGRELIARNLNELGAHRPDGERLLVREVDGVVRGVLSNGYRTDDSRPALDALIGLAVDLNAVVADASALDTRTSVKVMVREPVEIFPGEWAVLGLDYRNSDYGHGAREVCGWILRLLCLNGAVTTANFRKVHLGARIQDEIEYSNKTRALNQAATVSATKDIARALLGPEAIKKLVGQVRAANATALDPDAALRSIKKEVNKEEEKAIVEKFNSPDVELLPPGNTVWRFSNAISWLANQTDDGGRRLELEKLAGDVMGAAKAA
jgi:hypothetical protein